MHAAFGIPNGKGLLSPIIAMVAKHADHPRKLLKITKSLCQAFIDWHSLLLQTKTRPTLCCDLVPAPPDFIGYCDASQHGAGRVWFGGKCNMPPIVWRVPFPPKIKNALVSESNPNGHLTNSDLEMARMLLSGSLLSCLHHLHTHMWPSDATTPQLLLGLLSFFHPKPWLQHIFYVPWPFGC